MFAKFAFSETVRYTSFERIIIKMKEPDNKAMGDAFLKDMR